jgi:radical SAM superfamily enzyme YgiQ (UPF0313 family)
VQCDPIRVLFLMPMPRRLLSFAAGVQQLAAAIDSDERFASHITFMTLEDDGSCAWAPGKGPDDYDLICFGLTNPGGISDYFTMIEQTGVGSLASERGRKRRPLVCAGGWGVFNPEPFADLFDLIFLGNATLAIVTLCDLLGRACPDYDEGFWRQLVEIPGVYVPHLYDCESRPDGRIERLRPAGDWVPARVSFGADLPGSADTLVFDGETAVLTATKGCAYSCRFCQIGFEQYQETPLFTLLDQASAAMASGATNLIVNSATLPHYRRIDLLLDGLYELRAQHPAVKITLGSMRADELTEQTLARIARLAASNTLRHYTQRDEQLFLSLAPEVGSDHLRLSLGKHMPNHTIFQSMRSALTLGLSNFVLYFMVGFDFHDDASDIIEFVRQALDVTPGRLVIRVTPFIPSVRTPMQRFGMLGPARTWRLVEEIRDTFAGRADRVEFSCAMTRGRYAFEALCMRGDRRISRVLADLHARGVTHASEDVDGIDAVLAEHGLDLAHYLRRFGAQEAVPWQIVDAMSARRQTVALEVLPAAERRGRKDAERWEQKERSAR